MMATNEIITAILIFKIFGKSISVSEEKSSIKKIVIKRKDIYPPWPSLSGNKKNKTQNILAVNINNFEANDTLLKFKKNINSPAKRHGNNHRVQIGSR